MQQVVIARIIHLSHPDVAARAAMSVFRVVCGGKEKKKRAKKKVGRGVAVSISV